ncbi:hypothetical protein [Microvirga arabica]|uniref:hypothetical protein n=1 Tax=Microvirga arabica TaxID=1128671 RepID=UPI001939DF18|nr:hypothetical protein [Microvirga arabica]MBM1175460.1 hypothetical protein [Microvirga arabica]
MMGYTYHDTRDELTAIKLLFTNWYVNSRGNEMGSGGPLFIRAKIEYPAGIFTDVTFDGREPGIAPDGASIVSDFTQVHIPAFKRFKVHVKRVWSGSGRAIYNQSWAHSPEDTLLVGPDSETVPLGSTLLSNANGLAAPPAAILGITTRPSMLVIGDSNEVGTADTYDRSGLVGKVNRLFGSRIGYINAARGSESSYNFVQSHSRRVQLADYTTHIYIGHTTNDTNFITRDVIRYLEVIARYFPEKTLISSTASPITSSLDGWKTLEQQTPRGNETKRLEQNRWRRGNEHPFHHMLEYADRVESTRDSGRWKVPGYTSDGVHGSQIAALAALEDMFDLGLVAFEPVGDTTPPTILSAGHIKAKSSERVVTTLEADESGTWSIHGGRDAARFTIDPLNGALQFVEPAADFKGSPAGPAGSTYTVNIRFTDHAGLFVGKTLFVAITD